jgi:hypothetical protein
MGSSCKAVPTWVINLTNIVREIFGAQVKDCGVCVCLIEILMKVLGNERKYPA